MCKMSFLATEFNIFFDIKKINPLHLQVWTLWNVVEFSTLTNLITWKSHLCGVLPRPPGGAPGWTLVFTLDMLDRRAQLALGTLPPVVITGWLQGLELGQQHSMGVCFPWVPGQEVKDFLSTLGETLTASIRGEWSSFCLKMLSQEANNYLQDVGFLQLGVRLQVEELWMWTFGCLMLLLIQSLCIFSTIGFLSYKEEEEII